MKKVGLKKRFRYWIDDKMSKGTASMIKLLLFTVLSVVIVVTALVMAFDLGGDGKSLIAIFWDNLRSAMSSSFPASNSGTLLYIVLYTVLGLTGMVFTGMLVGIFSSTMRGKIIALQKENPEIIESGHRVILGFRIGEYALLSEMVAAAEGEKRTIVVVENMDREEMEQAIRKNVKIPKNIRITVIKGDPTVPNSLMCCAIPDCSVLVINTRDRGRTVKTLLAVEILLMNAEKRPKIVATVDSNITIFPRTTLKAKGISMLHSGDVVARIIAHAATQTGIYEAFMDIIDFDNCEFYFEPASALEGLSFGTAVLSASGGIVTGIYRDGEVLLNPVPDTEIKAGDLFVVFEEAMGKLSFKEPESVPSLETREAKKPDPIEEVVIFGVNTAAATVIRELPDHIQRIKLIGLTPAEKEACIPSDEEFASEITADYRNTDYEYVLTNMIRNADHIILLSDRKKKEEDADTETMLRIIRIRDIRKKYELGFTVTAEIRSENNRRLIQSEGSEDFVVATDLSSMMLAQITEDTRRVGLFNDILDEEGSEIYLKPSTDFEFPEMPIPSSELKRILYSYGYMLLGIRTEGDAFVSVPEEALITVLESDRLIVLGEE